jgi:hypothetical protein
MFKQIAVGVDEQQGGRDAVALVLWLGSSPTYSVRPLGRLVGRVAGRGGRGRSG